MLSGRVYFEKNIPLFDEDEPIDTGSASSKPSGVASAAKAWTLLPEPTMSLIDVPMTCTTVKAPAEVVMRGRVLASMGKPDDSGAYPAPMSDTLTQSCMEESEKFPGLYEKIGRVRSSFEAMCRFEYDGQMKFESNADELSTQCGADSSAPSMDVDTSDMDSALEDAPDFTSWLPQANPMLHEMFTSISGTGKHRPKIPGGPSLPLSILAARPVSRSEYAKKSKAMEAYWKEWKNLERKGVWRWETLCEWDDVAEEARRMGKEINFGYLFGLMVEKGSEYPEEDVRRYYKYRVVFQGNKAKDQNWNVALYNEHACVPATLEASRIADIYSCFPGHTIEGRDVEQAYLSAEMEGTPTYIMLPQELWTPEMYKMKMPVFRLEKALYGHVESGFFWQEYCKKQVLEAGFEPVPHESWPCVYYNKDDRLLLIVYVDDMTMSGPKGAAMDRAWKKLGKNIGLEVPKGNVEGVHTFLGCTHTSSERIIDGKPVRCIEYDVSSAMKRCVSKFEEAVHQITGRYPKLSPAKTPFLAEDTQNSLHRAPYSGDAEFVECPSCRHTFSKSDADNHCTFKRGTKPWQLRQKEAEKLDKSPVVEFDQIDKPVDWVAPKKTVEPNDSWWADMLPQEYSCSGGSDLSGSEDKPQCDSHSGKPLRAGTTLSTASLADAVEGRFPAVATEVSAPRSCKDPKGQVKKPPTLLKGQQ